MVDDPLLGLREAARLSPDNVPLRRHLIDSLLARGQGVEAEQEARSALQRWPQDQELQLALARAFFDQGKSSHALVVLETLCTGVSAPPRAFLLQSRLCHTSGEIEKAITSYRRAVAADATLADIDLADRLGVPANGAPSPDGSSVVDGRVREGGEEPAPLQEVERPTILFNDVGGMETVKEEIRLKIIYPLSHAELYKAYGKAIGGGILLYGPPGCGKTHLARATAGEIKAGFISVGINEVLEMWIGSSERNLHEIFDRARRSRPCVLFFDEVDALAAARSDFRSSTGRQVINQFLAELDGVEHSNDGVLILAATNAPWHLDAAFKRPGRFDRILFVPPPDLQARAAILRVLLRGKPVAEIDHLAVAKRTAGCSGADLKSLIDLVIERKLTEAMRTGQPLPITGKDLLEVAAGIKATTKEWFANAKNFALYANQGGQYDEILKHLEGK
jgi:transitional endoplasmic reticulum ATPase